MKQAFILSVLAASLLSPPSCLAQDEEELARQMEIDMEYLQNRLGQVMLNGDDSYYTMAEYDALLVEAGQMASTYPDAAAVWAWRGIIKYNYVRNLDDVTSLSMAESAKSDLETAISLDPGALEGQAYTYLGALYLNQPGWPSGFGDEDFAGQLLTQALAWNPLDIDANYVYARYLIKRGESESARRYLETALSAPSRPGREAADEARRGEIAELLVELAN